MCLSVLDWVRELTRFPDTTRLRTTFPYANIFIKELGLCVPDSFPDPNVYAYTGHISRVYVLISQAIYITCETGSLCAC